MSSKQNKSKKANNILKQNLKKRIKNIHNSDSKAQNSINYKPNFLNSFGIDDKNLNLNHHLSYKPKKRKTRKNISSSTQKRQNQNSSLVKISHQKKITIKSFSKKNSNRSNRAKDQEKKNFNFTQELLKNEETSSPVILGQNIKAYNTKKSEIQSEEEEYRHSSQLRGMRFHGGKINSNEPSPPEFRNVQNSERLFSHTMEGGIGLNYQDQNSNTTYTSPNSILGNVTNLKFTPTSSIQRGTPQEKVKINLNFRKPRVNEFTHGSNPKRNSNRGVEEWNELISDRLVQLKNQRGSYSSNKNSLGIDLMKHKLTKSGFKRTFKNKINIRNSSFSKNFQGDVFANRRTLDNPRIEVTPPLSKKHSPPLKKEINICLNSPEFQKQEKMKNSGNNSGVLEKTAYFGNEPKNPPNFTNEIEQLKRDMKAKNNEVRNLKHEVTQYRELYQSLSNQVEMVNKNHLEEIDIIRKNHIKELNSLETEFKQLESTQLSFESKIMEKQNEIDKLRSKLHNSQGLVQQLESKMQSDRDKFGEEVEQMMVDKEKEIERYSKLAEEIQSESLKSQQMDNEKIKEMQDLIEELTNINENLVNENYFLKEQFEANQANKNDEIQKIQETYDTPHYNIDPEVYKQFSRQNQENFVHEEEHIEGQRPSIQFPMKSFLPISSNINLANETIQEVDEESEESPTKENSRKNSFAEGAKSENIFEIKPTEIEAKEANLVEKNNPYLSPEFRSKKLQHQVSFGLDNTNFGSMARAQEEPNQVISQESFDYFNTGNHSEHERESENVNYALEPLETVEQSQPQYERPFQTVKPNMIESEIDLEHAAGNVNESYLKIFTKKFVDEMVNLRKEIMNLKNQTPEKFEENTDNPYLGVKKSTNKGNLDSKTEKMLMKAEIAKLRAQNAALVLYQKNHKKSKKRKREGKTKEEEKFETQSKLIDNAIGMILEEVKKSELSLDPIERSEISSNIRNYFRSIDNIVQESNLKFSGGGPKKKEEKSNFEKKEKSQNSSPQEGIINNMNFESMVEGLEIKIENDGRSQLDKEGKDHPEEINASSPQIMKQSQEIQDLEHSSGVPTSKKEIGVKGKESILTNNLSDFGKYQEEEKKSGLSKGDEYVQSMFKELKMKMEKLASKNAMISKKLEEEAEFVQKSTQPRVMENQMNLAHEEQK